MKSSNGSIPRRSNLSTQRQTPQTEHSAWRTFTVLHAYLAVDFARWLRGVPAGAGEKYSRPHLANLLKPLHRFIHAEVSDQLCCYDKNSGNACLKFKKEEDTSGIHQFPDLRTQQETLENVSPNASFHRQSEAGYIIFPNLLTL